MRLGVWSGLLTVLAGFWLIVLVGLPLYVFPPADSVEKSDVVLVLGPPMQARLDLAEQLRDEGLVDRIVISVQASGGQTAQDIALCEDEGVTCVVADPSTTRGEVLLMSEQGDVRKRLGDRRDEHPARDAHALHLRKVLPGRGVCGLG